MLTVSLKVMLCSLLIRVALNFENYIMHSIVRNNFTNPPHFFSMTT